MESKTQKYYMWDLLIFVISDNSPQICTYPPGTTGSLYSTVPRAASFWGLAESPHRSVQHEQRQVGAALHKARRKPV